MVRTRLKTAATLTVVVLALTGFQTSSGGKGGSGGTSKSDDGGGCSSDEKDNDDYGSADNDGAGSSGGSGESASGSGSDAGGAASGPVTVTVVECVKPAQKKQKGRPARKADTTATVRIVSNDVNATMGAYHVTLEFQDAAGTVLDTAMEVVAVAPGRQEELELELVDAALVDKVKRCVAREPVRM